MIEEQDSNFLKVGHFESTSPPRVPVMYRSPTYQKLDKYIDNINMYRDQFQGERVPVFEMTSRERTKYYVKRMRAMGVQQHHIRRLLKAQVEKDEQQAVKKIKRGRMKKKVIMINNINRMYDHKITIGDDSPHSTHSREAKQSSNSPPARESRNASLLKPRLEKKEISLNISMDPSSNPLGDTNRKLRAKASASSKYLSFQSVHQNLDLSKIMNDEAKSHYVNSARSDYSISSSKSSVSRSPHKRSALEKRMAMSRSSQQSFQTYRQRKIKDDLSIYTISPGGMFSVGGLFYNVKMQQLRQQHKDNIKDQLLTMKIRKFNQRTVKHYISRRKELMQNRDKVNEFKATSQPPSSSRENKNLVFREGKFDKEGNYQVRKLRIIELDENQNVPLQNESIRRQVSQGPSGSQIELHTLTSLNQTDSQRSPELRSNKSSIERKAKPSTLQQPPTLPGNDQSSPIKHFQYLPKDLHINSWLRIYTGERPTENRSASVPILFRAKGNGVINRFSPRKDARSTEGNFMTPQTLSPPNLERPSPPHHELRQVKLKKPPKKLRQPPLPPPSIALSPGDHEEEEVYALPQPPEILPASIHHSPPGKQSINVGRLKHPTGSINDDLATETLNKREVFASEEIFERDLDTETQSIHKMNTKDDQAQGQGAILKSLASTRRKSYQVQPLESARLLPAAVKKVSGMKSDHSSKSGNFKGMAYFPAEGRPKSGVKRQFKETIKALGNNRSSIQLARSIIQENEHGIKIDTLRKKINRSGKFQHHRPQRVEEEVSTPQIIISRRSDFSIKDEQQEQDKNFLQIVEVPTTSSKTRSRKKLAKDPGSYFNLKNPTPHLQDASDSSGPLTLSSPTNSFDVKPGTDLYPGDQSAEHSAFLVRAEATPPREAPEKNQDLDFAPSSTLMQTLPIAPPEQPRAKTSPVSISKALQKPMMKPRFLKMGGPAVMAASGPILGVPPSIVERSEENSYSLPGTAQKKPIEIKTGDMDHITTQMKNEVPSLLSGSNSSRAQALRQSLAMLLPSGGVHIEKKNYLPIRMEKRLYEACYPTTTCTSTRAFEERSHSKTISASMSHGQLKPSLITIQTSARKTPANSSLDRNMIQDRKIRTAAASSRGLKQKKEFQKVLEQRQIIAQSQRKFTKVLQNKGRSQSKLEGQNERSLHELTRNQPFGQPLRGAYTGSIQIVASQQEKKNQKFLKAQQVKALTISKATDSETTDPKKQSTAEQEGSTTGEPREITLKPTTRFPQANKHTIQKIEPTSTKFARRRKTDSTSLTKRQGEGSSKPQEKIKKGNPLLVKSGSIAPQASSIYGPPTVAGRASSRKFVKQRSQDFKSNSRLKEASEPATIVLKENREVNIPRLETAKIASIHKQTNATSSIFEDESRPGHGKNIYGLDSILVSQEEYGSVTNQVNQLDDITALSKYYENDLPQPPSHFTKKQSQIVNKLKNKFHKPKSMENQFRPLRGARLGSMKDIEFKPEAAPLQKGQYNITKGQFEIEQ